MREATAKTTKKCGAKATLFWYNRLVILIWQVTQSGACCWNWEARDMEFRPCIDIHNGRVKQIVGGSLSDEGDQATENFVSERDAASFAHIYRENGVSGGHVILLNPPDSAYYEATRQQALSALHAFPGGLQIGGGVNDGNAASYIKEGASHVIVTSYVFRDGKVDFDRLERLVDAVGREHIVLDVSCRKRDGAYYVVTDRWQKFTEERVTERLLDRLCIYADEFLVHGVDVEGKVSGIEIPLVRLLGEWGKLPITYAGGVSSFADLSALKKYGQNRVHVTIGSALDLFGGSLAFEDVIAFCR